jgi:hypothetical protein
VELLGFMKVNPTYKIALSKAKITLSKAKITLSKAKMIAILKFNQQDNSVAEGTAKQTALQDRHLY